MIRRALTGLVDAFSFLEAILEITVVAVATLVLDFALTVSLAIQVGLALKDFAI